MSLDVLIGLFIKDINKIKDYTQIVFENGAILNIFNCCSYDNGSLFDVKKKEVINVHESQNCIEIEIRDSGILKVDLTDEGYQGPEALELIREGESPIIWN